MSNKFYPTKETEAFLNATVLAPKTPINQIALEGPPASGKTSLAYHIADKKGIPSENVFRMVCTRQTMFEQFTFEKTAKDGTILEVMSKFLDLVQKPSVILVDEYKLAQPDVIAGLNCLTDFEQAYTHSDGRKFVRHKDNILIFSTNDESFAGCKVQHGGFVDRLPTLQVGYSDQEDQILLDHFPQIDPKLTARLKKFAELIRQANQTQKFRTQLTTRGLIQIANMLNNKAELSTAIEAVIRPPKDEQDSVRDLAKLALDAKVFKKKNQKRFEVDLLRKEREKVEKIKAEHNETVKELENLIKQVNDLLK